MKKKLQKLKAIKKVMYKVLFILSITLGNFLWSCQKPGRNTKSVEKLIELAEYFSDGTLASHCKALADSTLEGNCTYYYKNGQLKSNLTYHDGIRTGEAITYHPNGQIESVHYYSEGLPHGLYQWFFPNGTLKRQGKLEMGKKEGWVHSYDDDGSILSKFSYYNDRRIGEGFKYYKNGKIKSFLFYHSEGKIASAFQFTPEGILEEFRGDILSDVDINNTNLYWNESLTMNLTIAVPPNWKGNIQVIKKLPNGDQIYQKTIGYGLTPIV